MHDTSDRQTAMDSCETTGLSRRELLTALGAGAIAGWLPSADATQELPLSARELWSWVQAQQVIEPGIAWLDTASRGPALRSVLVAEYRAREASNLDPGLYREELLSAEGAARLVGRMAAYLGAETAEIAFTSGAAQSLSTVALGLDLQAGDEVVTTTREHGAAIHPWLLQAKRRGIVVREVELPMPLAGAEQALGLLAGAVTPRTRVLAFAHVQHVDGAVLPVRDICSFARERDILSVVDGAQAPGMLKLDLRELGCDFYAASLDKWLNSVSGTGVLYVRSAVLERIAPLIVDAGVGWLAEPEGSSTDFRARWPATLGKLGHILACHGPLFESVEPALEFRERLGHDRIEARIRELAIYLKLRLQSITGVEILTPSAPGLWAGILSFRAQGMKARELADSLGREDRIFVAPVALGGSAGGDALRVSTHIFNTHDHIDRLLRRIERHLRF